MIVLGFLCDVTGGECDERMGKCGRGRDHGKMWKRQRDLCQAVQKCGRIVEGVDVTVILWWFFFFFFEIILYYFNELKLK